MINKFARDNNYTSILDLAEGIDKTIEPANLVIELDIAEKMDAAKIQKEILEINNNGKHN